MKLPGPDHPITITANPKRVRVSAGGVVIADTTHALTLKEASYPAVQYVPREGHRAVALLAHTERTTRCPYKGDATTSASTPTAKTSKTRSGPMNSPFGHGRDRRPPGFYPTRSRSRKVRSLIRRIRRLALAESAPGGNI
jgi:hypothetical protein